jgi:hypothetical protein
MTWYRKALERQTTKKVVEPLVYSHLFRRMKLAFGVWRKKVFFEKTVALIYDYSVRPEQEIVAKKVIYAWRKYTYL